MQKRSDILVHDRCGDPVLIVECKSPDVKVDQGVFDQIALYNLKFKVPYLVVTNGMHHYCCKYSEDKGSYEFLEEIPEYDKITPGH
jgi:hypothetical protein